MNALSVLPLPYRLLLIAAALLAAVGFGWVKGAGHEQAKERKAELAQQQVANKLVFDKLAENAKLAAAQRQTNKVIAERKDHELAKVRADLNVERLRIGPSWCRSGAGVPEPTGPVSGNAANTSGGVLSAELDAAAKALILESEAAAATGRACQAFVNENGLAP